MSSPEYLRRHFGIVAVPTGGPAAPEEPRISVPENLARRVGAVSTPPDINQYHFKPEDGQNIRPDVNLVVSERTPGAQEHNLGIAWDRVAAGGKGFTSG